MKTKTWSKEAEIIYNELKNRIAELVEKYAKGDYNSATSYAFRIGALADIERGLNKIKKRGEK